MYVYMMGSNAQMLCLIHQTIQYPIECALLFRSNCIIPAAIAGLLHRCTLFPSSAPVDHYAFKRSTCCNDRNSINQPCCCIWLNRSTRWHMLEDRSHQHASSNCKTRISQTRRADCTDWMIRNQPIIRIGDDPLGVAPSVSTPSTGGTDPGVDDLFTRGRR
jgi:hypothetical protein